MDANQVPLGSILPFKVGEVPDTFEVFDGRMLTLADHFELVRNLERQRRNIEPYWEEMGGARIKHSAWRTPNLDSVRVWAYLALPKIEDDVVLAIKARRTLSSDAADTAPSEVRLDDSQDGQPR